MIIKYKNYKFLSRNKFSLCKIKNNQKTKICHNKILEIYKKIKKIKKLITNNNQTTGKTYNKNKQITRYKKIIHFINKKFKNNKQYQLKQKNKEMNIKMMIK